MATLPRAPFWVPRPFDGPVWGDSPLRNPHGRGLLSILTSQTFFGAGGQVPTKNWSGYVTSYQETPTWYPTPENLDSDALDLLTAVRFFGAGGQVPTKNWSGYVTSYQETPTWYPAPPTQDSGAIQVTRTQVQFFGQPGQAPTKNWMIYGTYQETPTWYPTPENLDADAIELLTAIQFFGQPGQAPTKNWMIYGTYQETPTWEMFLEYRDSDILYKPVQPSSPWNWRNYDETPPWQVVTENRNSGILPVLTSQTMFGAPGQVVQFRANFTQNDPPPWSPALGNLIASINYPTPYGAQRKWVWTHDITPTWSPAPGNLVANTQNLLTVQTMYGAGGQVVPFRANFTQNDPPSWSPASENLNAAVIYMPPLSPAGAQRKWNFTWNDAASWSPTLQSAETLYMPSSSLTGVQRRWDFTQNDPAPWSPTLQNAGIGRYPAPTGAQRKWDFTQNDAAYWLGAPQPTRSITTQGRFYGQPGQVVQFRANFTQDDPSLWTWPSQRSDLLAILTSTSIYGPGGATVPRFWRFNYDDSAVWWQQPQLPAISNYIIVIPPPPPANVVYALVSVTVAFSNSIVGARTSVSATTQTHTASSTGVESSVSTIGGDGSESEVQ